MTERVAVIVPTRNRASQLRRALASALDQDHRELVVIVVDDGSTDDTPAVLDEVATADDRIVVVRAAPGEGGSAAAARNLGLDEATRHEPSVVAFLDDDDEWLPTKVGRQVAAFRDDRRVRLVGCHQTLVTDDDEVVLRGPDVIDVDDLWWVDHLHGASCVAIRFENADLAAQRFDETFPAIEDWDYYVRAASAGGPGSVARVPEVLVRYHDHGGPRLTSDSAHVVGHRRFLAEHGPAMSTSARRYHEARLALLTLSGLGKMRVAPSLAWRCGPRVTAAIAAEIVAGRVGRARRDPGLAHRVLARVLRLLRLV